MLVSIVFNDTATTEIYTLSLHDALPIYVEPLGDLQEPLGGVGTTVEHHVLDALAQLGVHLVVDHQGACVEDRKSTRLNSSHANISYAVFCLKKNKNPLLNSLRHFSASDH